MSNSLYDVIILPSEENCNSFFEFFICKFKANRGNFGNIGISLRNSGKIHTNITQFVILRDKIDIFKSNWRFLVIFEDGQAMKIKKIYVFSHFYSLFCLFSAQPYTATAAERSPAANVSSACSITRRRLFSACRRSVISGARLPNRVDIEGLQDTAKEPAFPHAVLSLQGRRPLNL